MFTDKKNVAIIGRGNAGTHLSRALSGKANVTVVNPHTLAELTGEEDYGVSYPMQTFSKDVELNYAEIPVFIEASDAGVADVLTELAGSFSDHVHYANSDKRRKLHVGSVFACNFANHLWALSEKWLKENGLDFSMMHALVRETTRKALSNSPASVQTGPARRHDAPTIQSHLSMLEGDAQLHDIYKTLTASIENSYPE